MSAAGSNALRRGVNARYNGVYPVVPTTFTESGGKRCGSDAVKAARPHSQVRPIRARAAKFPWI